MFLAFNPLGIVMNNVGKLNYDYGSTRLDSRTILEHDPGRLIHTTLSPIDPFFDPHQSLYSIINYYYSYCDQSISRSINDEHNTFVIGVTRFHDLFLI